MLQFDPELRINQERRSAISATVETLASSRDDRLEEASRIMQASLVRQARMAGVRILDW